MIEIVEQTPRRRRATPNRVRDRETKAWIHNASAVVFVSYAGQAMGKPDIDFLDGFLLGVPAQRRVIAVNKVDAVEDPKGVEAWVERLRRSPDPRIRNVMSAPELTVFVSGAGAILAATIEAGAELSAVQQEMAAILRRLGLGRDYLQPENHNLAKLRALVEERLIVNKGQGLIEEHTSFLNSIVERKRRAIEEQIAEHAEGQDLAGQDKEELSANRQRIQGQVKEINGLSEELKGDLSEMAQDAGQSLKGEVARIKASVIRCVEGKIGAITNTSNFRHQTLWALQECFEKEEGGLYSELREIRASIAERIESRMGKFGAKIAELDIFSRERVQVLLQVKAYDGLEVVRRHFHELLTVEAVGGLVEEVTYFWQRWFDTESGLEKVRLRIMRAVWEALDGQLSRLGESMVDMLNTSLSKLAEESRASLNEAMETRRREIESLLKGEAEREELIAHHAAATAALEAARGELEQLSESLNQTMGV